MICRLTSHKPRLNSKLLKSKSKPLWSQRSIRPAIPGNLRSVNPILQLHIKEEIKEETLEATTTLLELVLVRMRSSTLS
jgi:hypothetical protein